jgi:L-seryl-tRNA(Ser) seleniumtransferase
MEALRQIPPINDILRSPELQDLRSVLETSFGLQILDGILSDMRRELAASPTVVPRSELTSRIASETVRRLQEALRPSLRRVINASGVVLHTNLGRAPLPSAAIEHLRDVTTGYSNLEFDLSEGTRGKRDVHIAHLIRRLLGSEEAIVVNNNAAAVLLVLNSLGEGGEVIASRGEQVEIGGSFRIPEIMSKSAARLREVGTTNRTRIKDYENAIGDETRLLLRVHPSNFRMTGFTERPSLEEFAELGRRRKVPTFEDLGSGCLFNLESIGISEEPIVADSIRAGVDIVCFSGDKLLGGPQAGIIAGRKTYVDRIRQNPLFRALRVDKLTIAVLESVLLSYLTGKLEEIPIWRMLHATEAQLRARAESLADRIGPSAQPVPMTSIVGGGSAPGATLPSWGIAVKSPEVSVSELEERLRRSEPPIVARIEEDRILIDLRTVLTVDEDPLAVALLRLNRK